ncbi:Fe(3+) ABC transporter substrate-binding protein [Phyllobacterium phragmitis]|uniref:Fe(3+) ABC transporter substrate-binding protein n=1 Tax=Phyllobacterium phragmitis TaxID=2670329 RepID=A0A2S9IU47_9HYPH|nr:ABC transporter substrate-binding protein [Phyllobacterium phragmitis]PRD44045.1 Fe(3+) ABC transporter substrate-binding protein [Phyllobacterium phragmitis]
MKNILKGMFAIPVALAASLTIGVAHAETLTLYTSQPEADAAKTVEAFRKVNPDIDVQVYRSGTSDILSKLAAEFAAGAPQPDVLLIADAVSMEGLKKDKRLRAYEKANVDGFPADSYDSEKTYFGSKLITTGIAYNSAAAEKPKHWADLAKPAYKGQIVMPSPLYSGAAAYLLSGFALNPELGWNYFDKLKENELVSVRGNGAVLKSVASGEKPYGILVDFMALNAKAKGSPVEFVFPPEGVPAVTEPVAIMATAKNAAGAEKFVDFILSDDGQKLALEQGYLPAKASVGRPAWLPEGTQVKIMSIDTQKVLQQTDADKKRFSELFGG